MIAADKIVCDRNRRAGKGAIYFYRLALLLFLQQREERARLLRPADENRSGPLPHLDVTSREGRSEDR